MVRLVANLGLVVCCLILYAPHALGSVDKSESISVSLRPIIANLESAVFALERIPQGKVRKTPPMAGEAWYGWIMRRMPGEGIDDTEHYVPFVVEYAEGLPERIWVDTNFDNDISDDVPLTLFAYPAITDARCAVVTLSWPVPSSGGMDSVSSTIRIVMEPIGPGGSPHCHLQSVFAMEGTVMLKEVPHLVVLVDGNGDGKYTKTLLDGLLIDLNDDHKFDVSLSSEEFFPLRVSFQVGRSSLVVDSITPSGTQLVLRQTGTDLPPVRARIGSVAPNIEGYDTAGRRFELSQHRGHPVILFFWGSWCSSCRERARLLSTLYQRFHPVGLEVLGVSLDIERRQMASFRRETGELWPTFFSGRNYWEDPIARVFGVDGAGGCYLIDGRGRLRGLYFDVGQLEHEVATLLGS